MSNEWMPIPQVLIDSMDHDPDEFNLLFMRHIEGDFYYLLGEEDMGEEDPTAFFCTPWCGKQMTFLSFAGPLPHEYGFETIEQSKQWATVQISNYYQWLVVLRKNPTIQFGVTFYNREATNENPHSL
jgi:hypothetical protein